MTAVEDTPGPGRAPAELRPGASPRAIRDWLLPEDRERFVAEYETAMDEARASLDLSSVHRLLERWRVAAAVQSDPAAFRRMVYRAAEFYSGGAAPEGEPFEVTRSKAGM